MREKWLCYGMKGEPQNAAATIRNMRLLLQELDQRGFRDYRPEEPREDYLNVAHGLASWLLTKDHKRIAILYLLTVTLMLFVSAGVLLALDLYAHRRFSQRR